MDDGTGDRTTAWGLPSEWAPRTETGDTVTLTMRGWSRRVTALIVDAPGTGRAVAEAAASGTPAAGSGAAAGAPGGPLAGLLLALGSGPGDLLSADEVSQALGMPVTPRPLPAETAALAVRPRPAPRRRLRLL